MLSWISTSLFNPSHDGSLSVEAMHMAIKIRKDDVYIEHKCESP
jgi:hypothetical protein